MMASHYSDVNGNPVQALADDMDLKPQQSFVKYSTVAGDGIPWPVFVFGG